MTDERFRKELERNLTHVEVDAYERATKAFSWSFQQDVVTFLRSLHEKGIPLNHAIKCIMIKQKMVIFDRKARRDAKAEWERKAPRCPECGKVMFMMRVNERPETKIGGGFKTQWICPNQPIQGMTKEQLKTVCGYTEFSKRTPDEWFKKLRLSREKLERMPHPYMRNPSVDFVAHLGDPDLPDEVKEEK